MLRRQSWPSDRMLGPDDDALVLVESFHLGVAVVSDGEDVRRELSDLLLPVEFDLIRRVDREDLIRIHGHQDGSRVRLV